MTCSPDYPNIFVRRRTVTITDAARYLCWARRRETGDGKKLIFF
jgi:hypothetical protein